MFRYLGERETEKAAENTYQPKKSQSTLIRLVIIWGEYKRSLQTGLLWKNLKKKEKEIKHQEALSQKIMGNNPPKKMSNLLRFILHNSLQSFW